MKSETFCKLNLRKLKIAQLCKVNGGANGGQEDTNTVVTTTIPTRTQPSDTFNN